MPSWCGRFKLRSHSPHSLPEKPTNLWIIEKYSISIELYNRCRLGVSNMFCQKQPISLSQERRQDSKLYTQRKRCVCKMIEIILVNCFSFQLIRVPGCSFLLKKEKNWEECKKKLRDNLFIQKKKKIHYFFSAHFTRQLTLAVKNVICRHLAITKWSKCSKMCMLFSYFKSIEMK